jgi:hypothetical protein
MELATVANVGMYVLLYLYACKWVTTVVGFLALQYCTPRGRLIRWLCQRSSGLDRRMQVGKSTMLNHDGDGPNLTISAGADLRTLFMLPLVLQRPPSRGRVGLRRQEPEFHLNFFEKCE